MRIIVLSPTMLLLFLSITFVVNCQSLRAFPITSYIVDLNDSTKLVQVHLEGDIKIAEKQLGLLKELYRDKPSDTATVGYGRCQLIKGDFYYFTIKYSKDMLPREGDLLYTQMQKPSVYDARLLKCAGHFISLQDVYESPWYDRTTIFTTWSQKQENDALDSMLKDIHFTGDYFLNNNPSMNIRITGGRFDGKMVLNAMKSSTRKDLEDFIDYILARPRLYAGRQWKIAEIYATWLTSSAPTIIKS